MSPSSTSPDQSLNLISEKRGAVGWLTFSRPERMNAISLEMWQAIPAVIDAFSADPEIRVIVLKGAGDRAFVAGADISQFSEARANADKAAEYERINSAALEAIRACHKPTIAMINGYCIGGGMAIALSCDLRFASHGSTFAIPAAKLGLAYPIDGMEQVLRVVSPAFAKEIFYTARQFDHDEAVAMNLINRAVALNELESLVGDTCKRICANAPLTLRAAKHTIDAMSAEPENYDRQQVEEKSRICFASSDYQEGQSAFLEKRTPQFKGE